MGQGEEKIVEKQPLVSVIMPCYNGEKFISEAIESVINQTYQNWELIIVDDGSKDKSKEIIKQYCATDNRITYIQHKKNKGIPFARNTGIKISNGEYIAFLDQDDLWLPEKLKEQVGIFKEDKKQKIGLIFSNLLFMKDGKINSRSWPSKRVPKNLEIMSFEEITRILFMNNFIPIVTVLIRKQCFDNLGFLDEKLIGGADDYEFFIRLASTFRLKYQMYPLAIRREHKDNFSKMERFLKDEIFILEKTIKRQPQLQELKKFKLAELYYRLGRDYQIQENFHKAKKQFSKAIKFNPWDAKYLLIFIFCLLGRFGNWLLNMKTKIKGKSAII